MEKCHICGKEFSNLGVHLKKAHGISPGESDEDNEFNDEEGLTTPEVKEEVVILKEEESLPYTLQEFLDKNKITLKDLEEIVKSFKTGEPISGSLSIKNNIQKASESVKSFLGQKDVVVYNLFEAEELVKNHGYKVISVDTNGGRSRKQWKMKKE